MERVYMAGCGGMLGQAFYEEFAPVADSRCTDIDVNEDWLDYLDFRDLDAYRKDVLAFAPDLPLPPRRSHRSRVLRDSS